MPNGNLVLDFNKKITAISYNHLNLPEIISINTSKTNLLKYTYDAAGIKLQKMSVEGEKTTWYDYGFRMYDPMVGRFPR
jgi:hypothetical protein